MAKTVLLAGDGIFKDGPVIGSENIIPGMVVRPKVLPSSARGQSLSNRRYGLKRESGLTVPVGYQRNDIAGVAGAGAAAVAPGLTLAFARENEVVGKGVGTDEGSATVQGDAYRADTDDQVLVVIPQRGAEINAYVTTVANINVGDRLTTAGDGTLTNHGTNENLKGCAVAIALQAHTHSASATKVHLPVEII